MPGVHQQLQVGTPKLISNLEVLKILQKRASPKSSRQLPANRIAKKVQEYLQTTHCTRISSSKSEELLQKLQSKKKRGLLPSPPKPTNGEDGTTPSTSATTTSSTGFGLTYAEAIQCLNMVPTEPVEIHLLVEDLQGRLSESQQDELLELIKSYDTQTEGAPTTYEQHEGEVLEEETQATADGYVTEEDSKPAASEMKTVKEET